MTIAEKREPPASTKPPQLKRATFSTSRLLDFCSAKELTNMTGHPPSEWPLVIVKELVDNSLDACEDAGIAPVVHVTVDGAGIEVADNGPGIPAETVEELLDYAVKVSSHEAYVGLARGAQGNALQSILAMPYALNGQRGRVQIEAKGVRHTIEFTADHIKQMPVINHIPAPANSRKCTSVRVQWPFSPSSQADDVKAHFLQIANDFTWLNPHLTLQVDLHGEVTRVEATDPAWTKWRPSDPTSPHWYDIQHLERLIAAYIGHDDQKGDRERTVREFISEFDGLRTSTKQKAVLDATGLHRAPLSHLTNGQDFNRPLVASLLAAMKGASKVVKPAALGVIGEYHLRQCLEAEGCEMESFQYHRILDPDGLPTIVEAAYGYCPDIESRRLVTGLNWSAAIHNPFRVLGGQSLDSVLAGQWVEPEEPCVVVLHVARPRTAYTDRGKSSVVVSSGTTNHIIDVVDRVTKKWAKERKAADRSDNAAFKVHESMTRSQSTIIKQNAAAAKIIPTAYLKASAGGTLPALARQIMYAARPYILEQTNREKINDGYFTQTLLPDYMDAHPETDDWNVAFDARGHFHEPHTDHEVPLGTIDVRDYLNEVEDHIVDRPTYNVRKWLYPTRGPKHRYGAILFIEKEGFMPMFNAVQLAERYDIAIMSTKGMSVIASRKLADKLCGDHSIPLLVVHDFDKSGFSIVGTLMQDTRRYKFQNKIDVIDVGLRIGDIGDLPREPSGIPKKQHDAARLNLKENGATPEEIEFLLEERVELNAFTSDALVAWLEKKLEEHGVKKIVPDDATLTTMHQRASEQSAIQTMIDEAVEKRRESPTTASMVDPVNLRALVEQVLKLDPLKTWDSAVMEIVE